MDNQEATPEIQITLIGAESYTTLTRTYRAGSSYGIRREQWDGLQHERNPATGKILFALTSDVPAVTVTTSVEPVATGRVITGEIDTGMGVSVAVDDSVPDGSDLRDLEETGPAPLVAPDPLPEPSAPRKFVVGKGKPVRV